jgi:hypothetical protein
VGRRHYESPPQNVVRVDPSVVSIPACAFERCKKLAEVELCEGLVEIGEGTLLVVLPFIQPLEIFVWSLK